MPLTHLAPLAPDDWFAIEHQVIRKPIYIRLLAGLIGASICIVYFFFLDPGNAMLKREVTIALLVGTFVFFAFIGNAWLYQWEKDIRHVLKQLKTDSTIHPPRLTKAQQRILDLPFVSSFVMLINWFLAALIVSTWIFYSLGDAGQLQLTFGYVAKVFIGMMLSGGVTSAIVFVSLEALLRNVWPLFFPNGGLAHARVFFRVKLRYRMLITFALTGILPIFFLSLLSYDTVRMMNNWEPDQVVTRLIYMTLFIVAIEIPMIIILSHFFSIGILHPIKDMEHAMKKVARGDYNASIIVNSNYELGLLCDQFNQMVQEINSLNLLLKKNTLQTVCSIAKALGARDPYTEGHAQRVSKYAGRLAARMGLDTSEVENIEIGGMLHDIGKIGFSDRIFSAEDAGFSGEMLDEIRRHPEIGVTILKNLDFLGPVLKYVLYHHEKLDGNGYPYGLKSHQTPMGAKIISVVDCFDAITTDRPYHAAMSQADAFEILRKNTGNAFSPEIVEVFIADIHENGMIS